ncbi:glutamate synthase (NADPH/NADH) small chain [Fontibacillus panacisegetis]|uniref:Glutamate synthase (NADPH/NADH) small chain n=1 Tax=Fontibacillus panacisegetis TaxID=670482 RepID=A0A1G7SMI0_9BACL|nr:glutamate synthase subunit beta [Fontibacillus panacisegetis]SDG24141.1 glutamate synthase (NADPH/NADH) small chain [Fontibacillus panacisegetis]
MGKTTGFLEYEREVAVEVKPLERISSWCEFTVPLDENKLREQGARCMDCGTPFCHVGRMLSGMASGCPVHNLVPEWNDLVYRGSWKEALKRLHKTNNFPEFTGRVCPAPCEGACTVGKHGSPVTIKSIERAIVDKGFAEGWIQPAIPATRTGKKVAVIGSGPAGMACAAQLNQAGHLVTVYERADRVGGLLMYGIPNMKLDKGLVQRRVDLLAAEGVTFITGTEIGKDIPAAELKRDFDAVVLCGGSTKARDLNVQGREFNGIYQSMEFLTRNTRSLLDSNLDDGKYLSAKGKNVVVIGGGDTGTDCVATAIRHGCRSVTQLEIMPQPPLTRQPSNPWPEYPKVLKTDYGQIEAISIQGEDPRRYVTSTKCFVGNADGQVTEVHTVDIEWTKTDSGRLIPIEIPGSEKIIAADMVLLALGFTGPEEGMIVELGLEQDERSNIKAEEGKYKTNVHGVFAAGDMRRGQSLVVWAIDEGRQAAREVDLFLMGETQLP